MDIRQLRYFVHVADLRSFTRASAFLGVSQPALSRQMRLLEEELGVTLLHRHGHGISLTTEGALLLERCTALLKDFEDLRQDFIARGTRSRVTGVVGIGMPVPVTPLFAEPFLSDVKASTPGISLRVVEGFSALIHEWLLSGSIDLAILYNPRPSKVIGCEPLLVEDLYAVGAPTDENKARVLITLGELARSPLVLPHKPHFLRDLVDLPEMTGTAFIEVDALSLMIELARSGRGYTILPMSAVASHVAAGQVAAIPIHQPGLAWNVSLCHSKLRPMTEATGLVRRLIRDEVARLVGTGRWIARLTPGRGADEAASGAHRP